MGIVKNIWGCLPAILLAFVASIFSDAGVLLAEEGEWHYHYYKEKVSLEIDENSLAVFDFEPGHGRDVAAYLRDAGVRGFQGRSLGPGWSLFSRPPASAAPGLARRPDVRELIATVARRPDNVFFYSPVFDLGDGARAFVPPDVLVRFREGVSPSVAQMLIEAEGGSTCQEAWGDMENAYSVDPHTFSGIEALAMANRLAELPEVRWAEPGLITTAEPSCSPLSPNPPADPHFNESWGLENLNDVDLDAVAAWQTCSGSPAIKIAIIDDGVDSSHEDLNVVEGADCTMLSPVWSCENPDPCVSGGDPPDAESNHGTTVAGVVAATANGVFPLGSVGIAPDVSLVSIRTQNVLNTDPRRIVGGLTWAEARGVRVTNFSWNTFNPPGGVSAACVKDKYFETRASGMVHFASAGNHDLNEVFWPASLPTVNAVSAIDVTGDRWIEIPGSFASNYGAAIGFSAPGSQIFTTDRMGAEGYADGSDPLGANYVFRSGTSYAAPFAAGVAALILSHRPDLSADAVESIMCEAAFDAGPPGRDEIYGCGIVNALSSLQLALTKLYIDGFESGNIDWWSNSTP